MTEQVTVCIATYRVAPPHSTIVRTGDSAPYAVRLVGEVLHVVQMVDLVAQVIPVPPFLVRECLLSTGHAFDMLGSCAMGGLGRISVQPVLVALGQGVG